MQHASQIDTPLFFADISGEECASNTLPEVETPLGTFAFFFELNGKDVTAKPNNCFDLSSKERLFHYELEEAIFELFIFPRPIDFTFLPHLQVESCITCVLRLTSKLDDLQFRFSGVWLENECPEGDIDTGERLMGMTWEDARYVASLGTGDEEWHHPYAGKLFPARWKQLIPKHLHTREQFIPLIKAVDERGLIFEPPDLMNGEACQLTFAFAWADLNFSPENYISTIFAVDRGHEIKRDDLLPLHPDKTNT